jgi:hypothetical protein
VAAHVEQGFHETVAREAEFAQELAGGALVVNDGEKEMLDRNVFVFQAFGLLFGAVKKLRKAVGYIDLIGASGAAGDFGKFLDFLFEAFVEGFEADVGAKKDRRGQAAFLFEHGEEEVFDVNLLIPMLNGAGLSEPDGVLRFFGKPIHVHY